MDIAEGLYHARVGGAVAFLGSGFSVGATNIAGEPVPNVRKLRDILSTDLGIQSEDELALVADMYVSEKGQFALNSLLFNQFSARSVSDAQIEIMKCPWRRLYSTNYDNVAELAAQNAHTDLVSLTVMDPPGQHPLQRRVLVHLHGRIPSHESQALSFSPQLGLSTYNTSHFISSPWAPTLRQDLRFARAVFFVGYSMRDLDISRLIYDDDIVKEKTFIITGTSASTPELRYLKHFGTVLAIGTEELARELSAVETTAADFSPATLVSFRHYSPPASARVPTQDDYVDLLTKGTFKPELFSPSPERQSPYAVIRTAVTSLRTYRDAKRILIHSGLGNGKTIALEQVAQEYASKEYDVYVLERATDAVSAEVDTIVSKGRKACFIFDDLFRNRDLVQYTSTHAAPDDVIICSCKTIQREIEISEIQTAIGRDFIEYDLNHLSASEIDQLVDGFDAYGLWGANHALSADRKRRVIREACSGELRSVVLYAFRSGVVSEKLRKWSEGVQSSGNDAQRFVLCTILCSLVHGQLSFLDICDVMMLDPRNLRAQLIASYAGDLILVSEGSTGIRSAILAEHLVQEIFDPGTVLDVLVLLITRLTQWLSAGKFARDMLRDLMRFAVVGRLFDSEDRRDFIVSFYERLRSSEYCRSNPQFWLQYAMARMDRSEYRLADSLLGMAESRASQLANYDSYQIENQRAKFLLLSRAETIEYNDINSSYMRAATITFRQIDNARAKVDPYPMRLISAHEIFLSRRADELDSRTKAVANNVVRRFEQRLESWPEQEYRVERREWEASIERIRMYLEGAAAAK